MIARLRRGVLPGVVAVGVILLAGCAATTADAAGHSPTPRPASSPHVPVGISDGVVGTAPIRSVAGADLGTLTFRKTDQGVEMELPSTELGDPAQIDWTLADSPFDPAGCGSDNVWEIGFPQNDRPTPVLEPDMFPDGDPSFFTTVVVVRIDPAPSATGCWQPILATGAITWTIPVQRPWVSAVDHGAASGARGTVTEHHGSPALYATAAGDTWQAIAARFGVSGDDLSWLNPNRLGGSTRGEAYAQQLLNLDPADRGNSESRRPH